MVRTSRFIAFGVIASELRLPRPADAEGLFVNPFVAGGIGARGYRANSVAATARYNAAAYLGAGTELGARRVRIRLEARDYVSGFRELAGGGVRVAHNDIVITAGLRLVKP
jgi:hypothetical protein